MLKIIAHKVAQLFDERYPGEHSEMRDEYARDQYESDQYAQNNVYFIRETFPNKTEHISDDGYTSAEDAEEVAKGNLNDSIEGGAIEVDIIHKDEGWQKTVWSREPEPKPMMTPFSR